ncbi:MAG: ankyrin repeat domain-containing protein [Verrucomicrobiota bacterium]|nr:ankyrin repeat domain-containing protein [Verrucomicrobiota bacterium]
MGVSIFGCGAAKDEIKRNNSQLLPAIERGDTAFAAELINKGKDVNAKADSGSTPLHSAAMGGHKETVKLLIAKGAAVNAKSKGDHTPVDSAERENYLCSPEVQKEIADLPRKHGGKTIEQLKVEGK